MQWGRIALAVAAAFACGSAGAAGPKIGFFTPMTGPLAGIGAMYKPTIEYVSGRVNAAGGWHGERIEITTYDDAGTTQGAADRFKQAMADGVQVIVAGGTSPLGAQNLADIKRWNERNPDSPVMLLIVGAEGTPFTGKDCYFYSFRFTTTPIIRANALAKVMKSKNQLGARVYSLQPDYTMGREMEQAVVAGASTYGYQVVGQARHDVFKIRDFSPFIEKVREAKPDTVFTASSGNDILMILQAAASGGLKTKLAGMFLDEPGNIASAGAAALGSYDAQIFNAEAGGADAEAYRAAFNKIAGNDPVAFANNGVITLTMLTDAIRSMPKAAKLDVKRLAVALERVKTAWPMGELTMRAGDHQLQLPLVISQVTKDAKYKADKTDMGFKPVQVLSAAETSMPVSSECRMERPAGL